MSLVAVTGCGKSGTHWAAEILTALGHACLHEQQFSHDRHGPLRKSECSWLMAPFVSTLPADARMARIMRNPYHVVQSAMRMRFLRFMGNPYSGFVKRHHPYAAKGVDHLTRVIRYVAMWDEQLPSVEESPVLFVDGDPYDQSRTLSWLLDRPFSTDMLKKRLRRVGGPNRSPRAREAPTVEQINDHPEGQMIRARAEAWGYL